MCGVSVGKVNRPKQSVDIVPDEFVNMPKTTQDERYEELVAMEATSSVDGSDFDNSGCSEGTGGDGKDRDYDTLAEKTEPKAKTTRACNKSDQNRLGPAACVALVISCANHVTCGAI
jgi:hypothetical protein